MTVSSFTRQRTASIITIKILSCFLLGDLLHKYLLSMLNRSLCSEHRKNSSSILIVHIWQRKCFLLFLLYQIVCGCRRPLHTWERPASSADPLIQETAASLPSLRGDCSSGPAFSDGRGWRSELRPETHSLPLWSDSPTACKHTKQHTWQIIWRYSHVSQSKEESIYIYLVIMSWMLKRELRVHWQKKNVISQRCIKVASLAWNQCLRSPPWILRYMLLFWSGTFWSRYKFGINLSNLWY